MDGYVCFSGSPFNVPKNGSQASISNPEDQEQFTANSCSLFMDELNDGKLVHRGFEALPRDNEISHRKKNDQKCVKETMSTKRIGPKMPDNIRGYELFFFQN